MGLTVIGSPDVTDPQSRMTKPALSGASQCLKSGIDLVGESQAQNPEHGFKIVDVDLGLDILYS